MLGNSSKWSAHWHERTLHMIDDHDDDGIALLRERVLESVLAELESGTTPLAIAAILNTISMSIYRTILSDEDYRQITDVIHEHRDLITSLAPLSERRLH